MEGTGFITHKHFLFYQNVQGYKIYEEKLLHFTKIMLIF